MRDDFTQDVKDLLAKRVGFKCSNPSCQIPTCGPREDPSKSVNVGVAAHVAAAAPGGPRYDVSMSAEERKAVSNGIWLCQKCAKLIDNDPIRYDVSKLHEWKRTAEDTVLREIEGNGFAKDEIATPKSPFERLERLMPELLTEMREDLISCPLRRELILMSKAWVYWESSERRVFRYYFEDHPELKSKMCILENYGLVTDITFNKVTRYTISEELAEYLSSK